MKMIRTDILKELRSRQAEEKEKKECENCQKKTIMLSVPAALVSSLPFSDPPASDTLLVMAEPSKRDHS